MSIFRRIFISNRGEIALRIIRTCKELGIETVLGVSEPDRESLPTRFANRVVLIGPGKPADSYLNAELAVHTAKVTGCDAIHPGFGFLSENPHLAELCQLHDIVFIGPNANCLRLLGDKIQARDLAKSLGLPVLGGGRVENLESAVALAKQLTYPIMLKASAGGGGRGIRIIASEADLKNEFDIASAEAEKSFADGRIHLETLIREARHIEVQIIADSLGQLGTYGERDCSIQFNFQKMIEETPCSFINDLQRQAIYSDAKTLLSSQDYIGLATVEFLYEPTTGQHFFLEVNPRIQVEHPITEMVTQRDLVADQIRVSCGNPLSKSNLDISFKGHAIECRINAQNPENALRPSPGRIDSWTIPAGPFVRVDSHCYSGYEIPPFYDSMIAKLIVWGPDRESTINRALRALDEFVISGQGLSTNLNLLKKILNHSEMMANQVVTSWLESNLKKI